MAHQRRSTRQRLGGLTLAGVIAVGAVGVTTATATAENRQPPGRAVASAARELRGVLMEGHGDDFDTGRATPGYHVHTEDGRTLELVGVDPRRVGEVIGKPVRLRGVERGNRVEVEAGSLVPDAEAAAAGATGTDGSGTTAAAGDLTTAALGVRTVAVLMVNFADNPVTPWTSTQVRSSYFDGANSANAYFQDASDGRVGLSGEVFGWITITRPSTTTCDWSTWGSSASAAATAAGIDLSAFQYVSYVWPSTVCTWAGLGYLPGTKTYLDGTISPAVVSHELGHNFGVHHAGTATCKDTAGAPVSWSDSCTLAEYGDPFDVMGSTTTYRLLHGFHRAQLGWLTEIETVTSARTTTIVPVDTAGAGTRLVRIPRGDGTFVDLDYRQPTGTFDGFALTAPVVNGVSVRVNPALTTRTVSKLVDTSPTTTASFSDSVLRAGQSWTDTLSGATVSVLSTSAAGADVRIEFGPDTTAPTAPTNLKATLSGSSVALSWTAATDNRAVTGYVVRRGGVVLATVTAPSFTDTSVPAGTTADYAVSAVDGAGNESAPATVTVTVPVVDTTAPTAPTGLTASVAKNRTVTLRWTAATDDRGVTGYVVARTGRTQTVTSTSATDRPGVGTWTYTVVALDAAGNRSTAATVTVTVR